MVNFGTVAFPRELLKRSSEIAEFVYQHPKVVARTHGYVMRARFVLFSRSQLERVFNCGWRYIHILFKMEGLWLKCLRFINGPAIIDVSLSTK